MRAGPGELDWANQPNPFRRYDGAPLVRLPLLGADEEPLSPRYDDLYRRGSVPSVPLTIRSLSRLLQYSLALSAWKQAGATRWALRCNPSSGNLHPTEGYLLIGALPGLGDARGPVPLRAARARARTAGATRARRCSRIDGRIPAAGLSGRALVDPLARGVEVRRARLPLLPARRGPRDRRAADRRRGAGLERCAAAMAWPTRRSKSCSG